ncbi:MAG: S41 family peptidase, partial [Eubacteriales bacterium]|nr:S41 family peptidase [Eubacteriales bacterium]
VLPDCLITTLEGQLVDPPEEYRSDDKQKLEIPYVVLVNEGSASASEVFSGAIQDNNAAPLIGTTTFGKGIVQTSWSLGVGRGMIKLTTDAYRTPSGKLIHGIGLTPDIEVQQPAELQGISPYTLLNEYRSEDAQLNRAIEYLLTGK